MSLLKCTCCGPKTTTTKEKPVTRLIMTKGLPGSGKSTWAKEQVRKDFPARTVRINKDDLRSMLHDDRFHKKNERQIVSARDGLVSLFLSQGADVIVDDTNLNPVHEEQLRSLAQTFGADFHVQDFTYVPLHTCIKQDLQRARSVGERVIRGMYNQYLRPKPEEAPPPELLPGRPHAVLVDIDGTVAKMTGRSPFAWDRVGEDDPHQDVIDLVNTLRDAGAEVVFVSGRDGSAQNATVEWLAENVGQWTREARLYMRAANDMRKDSIVKAEIYDNFIRPVYNVWLVLDDRDQVVEMWRQRGLRTLQVAPGAF